MDREELLQQIKEWNEKDEHQKIVDAIEALPREEWDYELTCLLARAYNNMPAVFDWQLEKAVSLFESVRGEGKEDPLWHYRLGYALYYLDRKAEALAYFRRALELDPDNQEIQYFIKRCENVIVPIVKTDRQADENILIPTNEFAARIAPFFWVNHADSASVSLNVGDYLQDVFDTRADEGVEGSGYDWESLAKVFLEERMPGLTEKVKFDSESSMFCAYSMDAAALREFIVGFKNACEDKALILDLFSRAELD